MAAVHGFTRDAVIIGRESQSLARLSARAGTLLATIVEFLTAPFAHGFVSVDASLACFYNLQRLHVPSDRYLFEHALTFVLARASTCVYACQASTVADSTKSRFTRPKSNPLCTKCGSTFRTSRTRCAAASLMSSLP